MRVPYSRYRSSPATIASARRSIRWPPLICSASFDDRFQAFDQTGVLEAMRRWAAPRSSRWTEPGISPPPRKPFTARIVRAWSAPPGGSLIFTVPNTGHCQPRPCAGGAVAPGFHRSPGWSCQAGLRNRRRQMLAADHRPTLLHRQRHPAGR